MKNTLSFKIETEKFTFELETHCLSNFLSELEETLKEIGELDEEDSLEISSLSPEEKKILQLAGY